MNAPIKRAMRLLSSPQAVRWLLAAIIGCSYLVLALEDDLRLAIPLLIGVTALVTLVLVICLYLSERARWCFTSRQAIGMAIVIRALFVFRPPELSDDIFRYLWDGLTLLGGQNPYALTPIAAGPHDGLSAGLLALVNHSHLTTIYPPAAQLVFALGASTSAGVVGIKLILVLMDLCTCLLLMLLLKWIQKPPWLVIVYAWHPLPVLEIAASGHIDAAGMLFAVLAVYLCLAPSSPDTLLSERWHPHRLVLSGLVFSMAVIDQIVSPWYFCPVC